MKSVRVELVPRRFAPLLLIAALLLALPVGASAATKPPSAKRQAQTAFNSLVRETKVLKRKVIKKRNKARLLKTAKKARRMAIKKPCKTVGTLKTYRKRLRWVHEPGVRGFEPSGTTIKGELQSLALRANVTLLQLPRSKRCGGGVKPNVTQTSPRILESDATHVRMKVALPSPTFAPQKVGNTLYQQMFMPGMNDSGTPGQPGLPKLSEFLGVPQGATVQVTVNGSDGYDLQGVNLFPTQNQPIDALQLPSGAPSLGAFEDPPFVKSGKAYNSKKNFPANPAHGGGIGTMRDLLIGGVDVAGGQYRAKSDKLHVFTSLDVTVKFNGGTGKFGDATRVNSPWNAWFARNYKALLGNYDTIIGNLSAGAPAPYCGEDVLIVSSPALSAAATELGNAKKAQGYLTKVALTGAGAGAAGSTSAEIQQFIRGELTANCLARPQYVLLLGNTDAVPTFHVPCTPGGSAAKCDIASDLPYSLDGVGSDLFADVELGRIPATSPQNALDVVHKIAGYETSLPAPAGDDFYSHATVTGYFQPQKICVLNAGKSGTPNCDPNAGAVNGHLQIVYSNHRDERGFTLTSDRILRAMKTDGVANVDRLWTTDDSKVDPQEYYDGSPIPANLQRPAFAWDADTSDFLDAYNGGRFLILHRDHGWPDGWAAPTLSSANTAQLVNGTKLPVVFGINCSSARFDNPANPSFVEEQIESTAGGAVAGFGDTRDSPSFPNNHMALGFFDSLFPSTVPSFGSSSATRRLGDVLLSGKVYMATQQGLDMQSGGDTYKEHFLFHLLGDPSMQMWSSTPRQFDPAKIASTYRAVSGEPGFNVDVTMPTGADDAPPAGAIATLFHGEDAIGRAVVNGDGKATIVPEMRVDANDLTVRFQQDGTLPASDPVDAPATKQATTLTLTGPTNPSQSAGPATYTGHLDPAFPGAPIHVTYTRDSNGDTIAHDVVTDANGDYSDSVTFASTDVGRWKVRAAYAGDLGHDASSAPALQISVSK